MTSKLTIKLPSRMEYLGVPDVVLMEIGGELDCARRSLEELGTAVIEACTNAMEHGNHLDDAQQIEVVLEIADPIITVTVLDHGGGFDFVGWQPSAELMRQRGRGIMIMREFTDDLAFGRDGEGRFFVRLVKTLAPAGDDGDA
ncbi:MAG: ATP-binding protein [Candidatus Krumholzibacteriia bacterium]